MYQCKRCRNHKGGCNWLDGMVVEEKCPHCGKKVKWFQPTALGAIMDEMSQVEIDATK